MTVKQEREAYKKLEKTVNTCSKRYSRTFARNCIALIQTNIKPQGLYSSFRLHSEKRRILSEGYSMGEKFLIEKKTIDSNFTTKYFHYFRLIEEIFLDKYPRDVKEMYDILIDFAAFLSKCLGQEDVRDEPGYISAFCSKEQFRAPYGKDKGFGGSVKDLEYVFLIGYILGYKCGLKRMRNEIMVLTDSRRRYESVESYFFVIDSEQVRQAEQTRELNNQYSYAEFTNIYVRYRNIRKPVLTKRDGE